MVLSLNDMPLFDAYIQVILSFDENMFSQYHHQLEIQGLQLVYIRSHIQQIH